MPTSCGCIHCWAGVRYVDSHDYSAGLLTFFVQDMIKDAASLRQGARNSYHDQVFEHEVNDLINTTQGHYEQ